MMSLLFDILDNDDDDGDSMGSEEQSEDDYYHHPPRSPSLSEYFLKDSSDEETTETTTSKVCGCTSSTVLKGPICACRLINKRMKNNKRALGDEAEGRGEAKRLKSGATSAQNTALGATTSSNPWTEAVMANNLDAVKSLLALKEQPNINETDASGFTPLTLAVTNANEALVAFLLDSKHIDPNKMDANGNIPLIVAIDLDHIGIAGKLLHKGADINAKDRLGHTPLKRAITLERQNIIIVLTSSCKQAAVRGNLKRSVLEQMGCVGPTPNKLDTVLKLVHLNALAMIKPWFESLQKSGFRVTRFFERNGPSGRTCVTLAAELDRREIIEYFYTFGSEWTLRSHRDRREETPLSIALCNRNLDLAKFLLQKGCHKDVKVFKSKTPLLNYLIKTDYVDGIKLLLEHNISLEPLLYDDSGCYSPLNQAIKEGNEVIVKLLLDKGARVNKPDAKGYIPLTLAVRCPNIQIASTLRKYKADINQCDGFGRLPLTLAIKSNSLHMIRFLLQHKANLNKQDGSGMTALTTAIKHDFWESVRILHEAGANMNLEDASGHTPLTLAISLGRTEIARYLVDTANVDVNAQCWYGSTALINAIWQKCSGLITRLIVKGANIEAVDWNGRTALVEAVAKNCLRMVQLLINHGCDVNFPEWNVNWVDSKKIRGHTALTKAIANNNAYLVAVLLTAGADVEQANGFGRTPLVEAVHSANLSMIEVLREHGAKLEKATLNEALKDDCLGLIECLTKNGVDDLKPEQIFTEACARSAFSVMNVYMDASSISLDVVDQNGYTAFTRAIEHKNTVAVDYLIGHKADLNKVDGNGFTPLTKALEMNDEHIVKVLVENKVDVSKTDGRGTKPITKVADGENIELLMYLLKHDTRNKCNVNENAPVIMECPICFESLKKGQVWSTKCGHIFCEKCLKNVIKTSKTCPTCRAPVTKAKIHAIYIWK